MSARFEALLPDKVHGWLIDALPANAGAAVLALLSTAAENLRYKPRS